MSWTFTVVNSDLKVEELRILIVGWGLMSWTFTIVLFPSWPAGPAVKFLDSSDSNSFIWGWQILWILGLTIKVTHLRFINIVIQSTNAISDILCLSLHPIYNNGKMSKYGRFFGSRHIGPRHSGPGKLGPGQLGPGEMGPEAQMSEAQLSIFSYASSSTLHPCQRVSQWVIVSTSIASRLASLFQGRRLVRRQSGPRAQLSGAQLSGAQLSAARLGGPNLHRTDFAEHFGQAKIGKWTIGAKVAEDIAWSFLMLLFGRHPLLFPEKDRFQICLFKKHFQRRTLFPLSISNAASQLWTRWRLGELRAAGLHLIIRAAW